MRTEKERMLDGFLYTAGDKELSKMKHRALKLTRLVNQSTEDELDSRQQLLKELLGSSGKSFEIRSPFICDYGMNISIGENFFSNFDCIMLDVAKITIGKNVMFGPRVGLYTACHPIDPGVRTRGLEFGKPITIGDSVWVGANTTINPGVTIGNNVVIGSGSVVTKDIPDNVIAAGNPCKVIREINENDKIYWETQENEYHDEVQVKG
jgi:maltose O-acetyltransferase